MKRAATFLLLATVASLASAGSARAQLVVENQESFRTPQRFALELRFGPYSPEVDKEFDGGKTPHRDIFGDYLRVMPQLEFDYQFYRAFGSAAVGLSIGYFRENADSPKEPDAGGTFDVNDRSQDNTRLSLYPIAIVMVYRADQLFRRFGVPFVPYVKAGLNYTIWSVYDDNGEVVSPTGALAGRGRGGTRGWQAAVGMSLVMDFLDPGAARSLDSETGINHTHLFFELAKFDGSGLGQKNRLQVGDSTWMAGLLFEL